MSPNRSGTGHDHGPAILANDVAELIENDPELRGQLQPGTYAIAMRGRHSYDSAGPRFRRFAQAHEPEHDLLRPDDDE